MKKTIPILLSILIIICAGLIIFVSQKNFWGQPNLDGFYKLTREDPLFYSPFFQTEEWDEALVGLKEKESQFKEVIIKNLLAMDNEPGTNVAGLEKNQYISFLKKNDLFPYQFLENLSLINQETNEFFKNPSVESGQSLLNLYDIAADSYIQDISSKIAVLEKTENYARGLPFFLFFVDSVSSINIVANDFLTISQNGYKLKDEIAKRKDCLSGKENCEVLLKTGNNSSFIDLLNSDSPALEGENVNLIKNIMQLISPNKEVKDLYKIKSFCWQSLGFEHWLYLVYVDKNGKLLVMPKLANQNYYQKTPAEPITNLDKALAERDIKFLSQPGTTNYECTDLTFYPQLITLDFLKEKIKSGAINQKDLEENLDYKLLMENQFGLMAPVINTISFYLETLKLYEKINKTPSEAEYLLGTRTAYSIFYFPFAKSIWRIDKSLQYFVPEEEKPLGGPSRIATLDELQKLGYSGENIKKIHYLNINEFINSILED